MRKILSVLFIILGSSIQTFSMESLVDKVELVSADKAKELLIQEDAFTDSWSQFDIDSRMHKANSTKEDLLEHILDQARHWSDEEEAKMKSVLKSIDKQITKQGFSFSLPDELFLIKTSGIEEGGAAGYTRANYIVLKNDILIRTKAELKQTVVHELYHILSRHNPTLRKEMYAIIGFKSMKELDYPESLSSLRITNPDAVKTDCFINVEVDGRAIDCAMIIYSTKEYTTGEFFDYLNVGLLALKGSTLKSIEYENGKPVIYTIDEVKGFYEQVGNNTRYIIHPEEILADNFTHAVLGRTSLPDQSIVEQIKAKLTK